MSGRSDPRAGNHLYNQEGTSNILQDVIKCIDIFEQKIADSESEIDRTNDTEQRVKNLLHRQLVDGLIPYIEYVHLNHINSLWASTLNTLIHYNIGCHLDKKAVVTNLLDLLSFNQITRELYVDIITKL